MMTQRSAFVWASLVVYGVSFVLPSFWYDAPFSTDSSRQESGFFAFFISLLAAPWEPFLALAWAANPVFWFGLHAGFRGRWHASFIAGMVSALLGITGIWCAHVSASPLTEGYAVWIASFALLALGSLWFVAMDMVTIRAQFTKEIRR